MFLLDAGSCQIRTWRPQDRRALVRHANNRNVSKNLRDQFPHPYTDADAEAWIAYIDSESPATSFAIAANGEAIGGIGIVLQSDVHRRSAELGFWLGESVWNRGIATGAVRAFTPYAFHAFDLLRIYAGVFSFNRASMRVLEKAGYVREAVLRQAVVKDGQVLDEVLFATTRDRWPVPPGEHA